jgi:hypothetical protein
MKTETIHSSALDVISSYQKLMLGGKFVSTPYYINANRNKDLRAMTGKGTPSEIIMEAKIWEKLKGINFRELSEDEIKQFLMDRSLGIDCSGFVVHVMNAYSKEFYKTPIWNKLKIPAKDIFSTLKYILRPAEQLGANIITNHENTEEIEIENVKPGDLIRSKAKRNNSHHIMLVTRVSFNDSGNVQSIQYTHASPYYGMLNGVKTGDIIIRDIEKPLWDQEWTEKDEHGVNHTFEGFMTNVEDNGLRRFKFAE